MAGKAPHVRLIDHHVLKGYLVVHESAPVKGIFNHTGVIGAARGGAASPDALAGNGLSIGIQEKTGFVKKKPVLRIPGAVHAVGVFDFIDIQMKDNHRIGIADPAVLRKRKDGKGLPRFSVKQAQLAGRGIHGMDGKTDAARHGGGAVYTEKSGADLKAGNAFCGRYRAKGCKQIHRKTSCQSRRASSSSRLLIS